MLYGIYNKFDAFFLINIVKTLNPINILECAPGVGRTASAIIAGLNKNEKINYYMFEKDETKLSAMKKYCSSFDNIRFHFGTNIVKSDIKEIDNLDFLFIDCFHDYILAKWFVHNLFNKVRINGLIHIHDIYFNSNGHGWEDAHVYKGTNHPDLIDIETIKSYYGPLYDKYKESEPITLFEPNIIERFCKLNEDSIEIFSTSDMCYNLGIGPELGKDDGMVPPQCSFYIKVKGPLKTNV